MLAAVPRIVWALLWIVGLTWRFEVIAEDGVNPCYLGKSPGRSLLLLASVRLALHPVLPPLPRVILISRSFDGELDYANPADVGFGAVRGSSSRGAREGLLGLKQVIEVGRTAIFTADGPRGPIYETKMGPIKLLRRRTRPSVLFHLQPE